MKSENSGNVANMVTGIQNSWCMGTVGWGREYWGQVGPGRVAGEGCARASWAQARCWLVIDIVIYIVSLGEVGSFISDLLCAFFLV